MTRLRQGATPGRPQLCPQCGSDDVVIGDVTSYCNHCGEVFPTDEAARRRVAAVLQLPIVHRPSFHDPAWREQFDRELAARQEMAVEPPPRTRPLIVGYWPEGRR